MVQNGCCIHKKTREDSLKDIEEAAGGDLLLDLRQFRNNGLGTHRMREREKKKSNVGKKRTK